MYIPEIFKITDQSIIEQFIKENGFGTLISIGETYPLGTHIPMELETNSKGEKILAGHISKENPQWIDIGKSPNVLVLFQSPVNHYISSSWYNHSNAPTWNYISVHISGKLTIIEGNELWESVSRLTNKYEAKMKCPFSLENTTKSVQRQMNGIVGFEIRIDKIECAFKLSQNRSEADFTNIIKELKGSNEFTAKLLADEMKKQRIIQSNKNKNN
jgi:transcriptional regulator